MGQKQCCSRSPTQTQVPKCQQQQQQVAGHIDGPQMAGTAARGTNSDGDHRCPTQITIPVHGGGWITLFVTDKQ